MVELLTEIYNAINPQTIEQLLWLLLSFSTSLTFFKELDHELQETEPFKKLAEDKSLIGILKYRASKVALDLLHHWYIGLGLIIYSNTPILQWIGGGLLVADIPDFIGRVENMILTMAQLLAKNE